METASSPTAPTALRWIIAPSLLAGCVGLIVLLGPTTQASAAMVHTLGLVLIAFTAYASVLYPLAGSLFFSVVVLVCLLWAWAIRQTPDRKSVV